MTGKDFTEVVDLIVKEDPRYNREAYFFLRKALDFTLKDFENQGSERNSKHVSGQELLRGIRDFALDQYGPMALPLFEYWGLTESENFGDMVFNLVEFKVFGKTDGDRKEDFENGFDFKEAFVKPFLPSKKIRLEQEKDKDLKQN